MRPLTLAGNWKLFKTKEETITFCQAINTQVFPDVVQVIVCPPFTNLDTAHTLLKNTRIKIGAQTIYEKNEGAYTGEISGPMLKSVGCEYVIIGHSERRSYFQESNTVLSQKMKAAFENGLTPIFCIGETLEQRESQQTFTILSQQLKESLTPLKELLSQQPFLIAYEPVWAIGTGKVATPKEAQEAHCFVRETLSEIVGHSTSQTTSILYGGSVKPDNIESLVSQPDIDGALIGGASLDPSSFLAMIQISAKTNPLAQAK